MGGKCGAGGVGVADSTGGACGLDGASGLGDTGSADGKNGVGGTYGVGGADGAGGTGRAVGYLSLSWVSRSHHFQMAALVQRRVRLDSASRSICR